MATIDATVGGASANSYVTEVEADAYWDKHFHNANWNARSSADKQTLCIMATRVLDYYVDWVGRKASDVQALRWPRYDVEDIDGYWIDGDEIPTFLKEATSELADHLASYNPAVAPDTLGFSKIKVDVLELVIDKMDRDSITVIPDSVAKMVEPYGQVKQLGGNMVVGLGRA